MPEDLERVRVDSAEPSGLRGGAHSVEKVTKTRDQDERRLELVEAVRRRDGLARGKARSVGAEREALEKTYDKKPNGGRLAHESKLRAASVVPVDVDLAAVRRRCAAAEAAALELVREVRQLATAITEFVERPVMKPRAVSVQLAARLLGLSRTSLYELLDCGALRSVKVGGRRLVPMAAIDDLLSVARPE